MSEWKEDVLGSVLEVKYGKDHKKLDDGNIPCFGSGGLMRNVDKSLYDKPSILIPRKGSLNNIMFQDKPFWTVDTMFWSKINENLVFSKFLFYQLTLIDYTVLNVGSAVPSLTVPVINEIDIKLPPLPEQKAIAEVLSSLDDKIDLLHRQNQTLEQMAETLFRQWFVEEAKEDWEDIELSEIAQFKNGKSRPKDGGNYPIYGGNGVLGYANEFNARGESIVIGRVGAYCGSLYFENQKIWVSDNAILGKAKNDVYLYFIFYFLRNMNLNDFAEGSSHPLLTQTLLNKVELKKPSINLLEKFNPQIESYFRKKETNSVQIRTLEKMRDTLLPKLMSGEVRVQSRRDETFVENEIKKTS